MLIIPGPSAHQALLVLLGAMVLMLQQATLAGAQDSGGFRALNMTAISASQGNSTLECWQFGPLAEVAAPGVTNASALLLGAQGGEVSYAAFPARTRGAPHRAPRVQFVVVLAGLARITLPGGGEGCDVPAGGVVVAADTADASRLGHVTDYPGDAPTGVMQVAVAGGRPGLGRYRVLHQGACTDEELGTSPAARLGQVASSRDVEG